MPIASAFRPALLVFGFALAAMFPPAARAQQSGSTAADGFDPNVNGPVYAVVVQPDGKVIVAGKFTSAQPVGEPAAERNNIARFLPDGRTDPTFNASVNDQINALVLQPNGQIVIGGKFTAVGGTTRRRVARLNADGSLDAGFDPNIEPRSRAENPESSLTPEVMALALQPDGKIVVGGGFKFVQPNGGAEVSRDRIARFNADGSLDAAFAPSANNMVLSLAVQPDGKILVGGGFTTVNSTTAGNRQRIARLNPDGTLDAAFDPKANNAVSSIEILPNGYIMIGGSFTTLQPNGAADPVTSGVVRVARLQPNGARDEAFTGSVDGPVSVLKVQPDGGILVGGSFSTVASFSQPYVARLLPNGGADTTFTPLPNYAVYAIALQPNGSVILGGGFLTLHGSGRESVVRNHVARVSFRGGLDAHFRSDLNGRLRSLTRLTDGRLLIGGSFTSVAGQTRSGMVLLGASGAIDPSFPVEVTGTVLSAVQMANGQIIVGGSFTRINNVPRRNLARLNLDGTVDPDYDPAPNNEVRTMALQADGKLVIGGSFTQLAPFSTSQPVSRSALARINADGTLDVAFDARANQSVETIVALADNKLLIGGAFTAIQPAGQAFAEDRRGIVRLNADGTLDSAFGFQVNGLVEALTVQSDGKAIVAGNFMQVRPTNSDAVTRNNIVRVNADGTLDDAFQPNPNGPVSSVVVQSDGRVVMGGWFTVLRPNGEGDGEPRVHAARLNADGSFDPSFNLFIDDQAGNEVVALALAPNDQLIVAGTFSQIGGLARTRVARVDSNGAGDAQFNADLSSTGGAVIHAITQHFNGQVLAAGEFTGFGGTTGSNIARFYSDSTPDTTFVPSIDGPVYTITEAPLKGAPVPTPQPGFAWLTENGEIRSGFTLDPAVTSMLSPRTAVVDANGRILISAAFEISGAATSLARFDASGALDTSFQRRTSGSIYAIRVLPDGKILIGGTFTQVGEIARTNLARLNADGTLDETFTAQVDNSVWTIELQEDGKILVGGNFLSVTPTGATTSTARRFIARLNADGTLDTGFDPNASDFVQVALPLSGGKILLGGNFTGFRPNGATETVNRAYAALVNSDGTIDTTVDFQTNGVVASAVIQPDGKIVLGGNFTTLRGETRNFLARLNADLSLDESFNPNANSSVSSVALQPSDNKIYAVGLFTALQPGGSTYNPTLATPRNRMVRLTNEGEIDAAFNPNFNSQVVDVVPIAGNGVIATGSFTAIQPSGSLMIGGSFTAISGVAVRNLALFGNDGSVSSAFLLNPNGAVHALLATTAGETIVAGAFTAFESGATRNRIARFTATNALDSTFDPNANGDVYALALQADGRVLVGGAFTSIGGVARSHLARLMANGAVDSSFAPSLPGEVRGVLVQPDGRILVLTSGSGVRSVLLRLMPDGGADASFTPFTSASAAIHSLALQVDGRIVVGGAFNTATGAPRNYIMRLNANGSLDPTVNSNPNGEVTAVTIAHDGKILIGGRFNAVDGLPRFGLARLATPTSNTGGSAFTINDSRTTITWVRSGALPEISGTYFESSSDLRTWTVLGAATRVANTSNWALTGSALAADQIYIRTSAIVPATSNSSTGLLEAQGRVVGPLPAITSAAVVGSPSGTSFHYQILASGATSYAVSGLPAGLSFDASTGVISGTPTQTGNYPVVIGATNANGTTTTNLMLIVGAPAGPKVEGSATDAGSNIRHPNGNTIDQFLLTGASANLRADPGEVVRISYIDLDDDIVQVEFSGAGRFTISLAGSSGPAAPVNYTQPGVTYMKGHATITVTESNETTHLSVFSVGTTNAVNQGLFLPGLDYDGIADIAAISIASANGRFGALRCANVSFFADTGTTGLSAPGVQFDGQVYVGDINAFGTAAPSLVIGSANGQTSIHGGDLEQPNGAAVTVGGLTQLRFVAGEASDGEALPAQTNKGQLMQNGVDVTSQIVVNP